MLAVTLWLNPEPFFFGEVRGGVSIEDHKTQARRKINVSYLSHDGTLFRLATLIYATLQTSI